MSLNYLNYLLYIGGLDKSLIGKEFRYVDHVVWRRSQNNSFNAEEEID